MTAKTLWNGSSSMREEAESHIGDVSSPPGSDYGNVWPREYAASETTADFAF